MQEKNSSVNLVVLSIIRMLSVTLQIPLDEVHQEEKFPGFYNRNVFFFLFFFPVEQLACFYLMAALSYMINIPSWYCIPGMLEPNWTLTFMYYLELHGINILYMSILDVVSVCCHYTKEGFCDKICIGVLEEEETLKWL